MEDAGLFRLPGTHPLADKEGQDRPHETETPIQKPIKRPQKSPKKQSPQPGIDQKHKAIRQQGTTLGIIGGNASGKTAYLHVLGRLIYNKRAKKVMKGWELGAFEDKYYSFFKDQEQLIKKNSQRTRIDRMDVFPMFPLKKGRVKIDLRAFDAAGENFERAVDPDGLEGILEKDDRYEVILDLRDEIRRCAGFIFLIDGDFLDHELKHERLQEGGNLLEPHELLRSLKDFLLKEQPKNSDSFNKVDTPIAFAITKADMLVKNAPDDMLQELRRHLPKTIDEHEVNRDKAQRETKRYIDHSLEDLDLKEQPKNADSLNKVDTPIPKTEYEVDTNKAQREAEKYIKEYLGDFYEVTRYFSNRSFHAISCWGHKPKFHDELNNDIEREDVAEARKQGRIIRERVNDIKSIFVEQPLCSVLNESEERMITARKRKKIKIAAALAAFIALLVTYPVSCFHVGRALEWFGRPAWAQTMYGFSAHSPLVFEQSFETYKMKSVKQLLSLSGKFEKGGNYGLSEQCLIKACRAGVDSPKTRRELGVALLRVAEYRTGEGKWQDPTNLIPALHRALEMLPGDGTEIRLSRLLYEASLQLEVSERPRFFAHARDGLGTIIGLRDLEADAIFDTAGKELTTGRPKAALTLLQTRKGLNDYPQYTTLLNHARKAENMIFIPPMEGVTPFYIDRYEVTNREYNSFIRERGASAPSYWNSQEYERRSPRKDCAVVYVAWYQACNYARYVGKRLPTVSEWEIAWGNEAYPWGNSFDKTRCNTRASGQLKAVRNESELIERDQSSFGVCGLAGNVAEYTSNTIRNETNRLCVLVKGGSFTSNRSRTREGVRTVVVEVANPDVGFRCAMDVIPNE